MPTDELIERLHERLRTRARMKREDQQGHDAKLLEEAADAIDRLAHTPASLADDVERVKLADELERLIGVWHDALPDGQGEAGDGTSIAKGKALCQAFYDNSDTIIAALRQPAQSDQADTPEALKHDLVQSMDTAHYYVNECERLREALREIRRGKRIDYDAVNFAYEPYEGDEAQQIARTALGDHS